MLQLEQLKVGSAAFLTGMIAGSLIFAPVAAADVSIGEIAGAIRSANYPCAHILEVDPAGDNSWVVQRSSGTFKVFRDQDGRFEVTQITGTAEK